MRIYIAAGIYLVRHHYFLKTLFAKMGIPCSKQLEERWLANDSAKIRKFGREHDISNKLKRKERENMSLRDKIKNRKKDIAKNFTYESRVGFDDGILVKK